MQITIHTIQGTYIVVEEKQPALINWLQNNAIKVGHEPAVREQFTPDGPFTGRQLINENGDVEGFRL